MMLLLLLLASCSLTSFATPEAHRDWYAYLKPKDAKAEAKSKWPVTWGSTATTSPEPHDINQVIWGTAPWPKKGQALNPAPPVKGEALPSSWWLSVHVNAALLISVFLVFCASTAYLTGLRRATSAADPAQEPLLTPRRDSRFRNNFGIHLDALCRTSGWRHFHQRALLMHLVRLAVPAAFLLIMYYMRRALTGLVDNNMKNALSDLDIPKDLKPSEVSDAIIEYTFSVVVLYIVMMSMLFFIWHVSEEAESGLRHLLHVSGLSRFAYLLATIGMEGFALSMLALGLMVAVAETLLEVRMVVFSSLCLMLLMLSLMVISALATGYLITLLSPTARIASMAGQFISLVIIFSAPMVMLTPVIPEVGGQYWRVLAFPTISAYRGLFELVAACVRGRCLVMSDVGEALVEGRTASLWSMTVGTNQSATLNDLSTPPDILLSCGILALFQIALLWGLVIFLDMRAHPTLHASKSKSTRAAAADATVLEVQNLGHQYGLLQGMLSPKAQVLNDVSFTVKTGEVLGLLGPNGAGKTTCIRCITGEEKPSKGSVAINSATSGNSAYIGLCPQETVVASDLTVAENLRFFAFVRGASDAEADSFLEHFLTASNLRDKRDHFPDTLSGGMKRRLAVSCALIAGPAVAILDEPTTGLDPLSRRGIWKTISEIKAAGSCCLLTTHMLEEAEALCGNLVVLRRGEVVASGSGQKLKEMWGTGYMLNIHSKPGEKELTKTFLSDYLSAKDMEPIKEASDEQMTFKLSISEEELGRLILGIGEGKKTGGIKHWGLSQASLEDTYLQIIQTENDPTVPQEVAVV